jgi:hypothetical protein
MDESGKKLLISPETQEHAEDGILTDVIQLQPYFSIYSLKTAEA